MEKSIVDVDKAKKALGSLFKKDCHNYQINLDNYGLVINALKELEKFQNGEFLPQ